MRIPKNSEKNARKLADACVECWDMDTLVEFAADILAERYQGNPELFKKDWKDIFTNVNDLGLPR